MKSVFVVAVALTVSAASAQTLKASYPSCDLTVQHALKGETGGTVTDARQAHISMRANILQADIGSARKAHHLSRVEAERLYHKVEAIRTTTNRSIKKQGFLSAAERATYDRQLDAVTIYVCRT